MKGLLFILVCIGIAYLIYQLLDNYLKYVIMGLGILASIFLLGLVVVFFDQDLGIKMIVWPIAISLVLGVVSLVSGIVAAVVVAPINLLWLIIKQLFNK